MGGDGSGFDTVGPAHEAGDANSSFEESCLAASQGVIAAAVSGVGTVVRHEDDERVAIELALSECVEDSSDTVVHGGDHGGIVSPFRILDMVV